MKLKHVEHFDSIERTDKLGDFDQLLIDTKTENVYHVTPRMGHAKAAAFHLGIKLNYVCTENASHLVSALVKINEKNVIEQIIIGRASLETRCKVRHSNNQLAKAKLIVENLVRLSKQIGEIKIVDDIASCEFVLS